jgi:uncharacterized membrane protein
LTCEEDFKDYLIVIGVLAFILSSLEYIIPVPFPQNFDVLLTSVIGFALTGVAMHIYKTYYLKDKAFTIDIITKSG